MQDPTSTLSASWEYLNMPKRRIRAAVYPRRSDPKLKDSATLESQTDDITKYCKDKGDILEDKHIYPEAQSAYYKSYRERPQFRKRLPPAQRGAFEVVVGQSY